MSSLVNLVTLFIDYNKIKEIPGWIGTFQNLKNLNAENNQLKNLPKEMAQLRFLETLRLKNNPLPETLCKNIFSDHYNTQQVLLEVELLNYTSPEQSDDPKGKFLVVSFNFYFFFFIRN
jgi:Leucine-rich repeat (LRR) protein